jgi:hypothetical protein
VHQINAQSTLSVRLYELIQIEVGFDSPAGMAGDLKVGKLLEAARTMGGLFFIATSRTEGAAATPIHEAALTV